MPRFRDPIHGYIELSKLELRIIDTTQFQRLRKIKQLATTYLVYHGAEHTRFGHSIGVACLVTRAFRSAICNYYEKNRENLFSEIDAEWYEQLLRIIALVHDIGHAPFSHGSENLFDGNQKHEDFTKKIICETSLADIIREIGSEFQKKYRVGEDYQITPELLWDIYGASYPESNPQYLARVSDFKFLKTFLDSELDCDKMDYLLRDSYYCGVNYGKFDLNRLLDSLTVYHNKEHNIKQLAIQRGGIHAFEEFVIARYFMFIQVYFHKTRRYLDYLLVKCIKEILPNEKYPDSVDEYLGLDDDCILERIRLHVSKSDCAKQFIERDVMSCIYETPSHTNANANSPDLRIFDLVHRQLTQNIQDCIIHIDSPSKLAHKIPVLGVYNADSGKGIPIISKYSKEPTSLIDESLLLKGLDKPINIKRIYIDRQHAAEAKRIVREFIDGEE